MAIIYKPKGAAGEYAVYAANFFNGCSNGCEYCYNKRGLAKNVCGRDKPVMKKGYKDEDDLFEHFCEEVNQNWRELAEHELFLSFTTDPWLPECRNLTKRAIATPKVFFTDTGLAAYLCGYRSAEELERAPIFGHLFENWAILSVLKSWWHSGRDCEAWFYRDREGHEVDLLLRHSMRLYPIEVKVSANPDVGEIEANVKALRATGTKLERGAVLCLANTNQPLSRELIRIGVGSV